MEMQTKVSEDGFDLTSPKSCFDLNNACSGLYRRCVTNFLFVDRDINDNFVSNLLSTILVDNDMI
jgi:hypothetical protein